MRADLSSLEPFRVLTGTMGSDASYGHNGAFLVPHRGVLLQLIASDGLGWDHVSVVPIHARTKRSLYRTPTWAEMCHVKALFFDEDEAVVQFHPPRQLHRNAHEYCLHLWRPQFVELVLPPPLFVAPEGVRVGLPVPVRRA